MFIFPQTTKLPVYVPIQQYTHSVLPSDLDWNRHMNNSKYLIVGRLARVAALAERGHWGRSPYSISQYHVTYHREAKLAQKLLVTTKVTRTDSE